MDALRSRPPPQFFTFDTVKTPRLELSRLEESDPPAYVLYTAADEAGGYYDGGESKTHGVGGPPNPPSDFRVDPTVVAPDEARNFAEYLRDRSLQVEVWDAETLLPLGEVMIDLRSLMRQQQTSVKVGREYDVIASSVTADIQSVVTVGGQGASTGGRVVGKLQVLMSNTGFRGVGDSDFSKTVVRPSGFLMDSTATVDNVGGKTVYKAVAERMKVGTNVAGAGVADSQLQAADANEDTLTYDEVKMLRKRYDPDNRGTLHYKEFLNDLATNSRRVEDFGESKAGDAGGAAGKSAGLQGWTRDVVVTEITRAFRRNEPVRSIMAQFDKDNDGMLTQQELQQVAERLMFQWERDAIESIVAVYGKPYPGRTMYVAAAGVVESWDAGVVCSLARPYLPQPRRLLRGPA